MLSTLILSVTHTIYISLSLSLSNTIIWLIIITYISKAPFLTRAHSALQMIYNTNYASAHWIKHSTSHYSHIHTHTHQAISAMLISRIPHSQKNSLDFWRISSMDVHQTHTHTCSHTHAHAHTYNQSNAQVENTILFDHTKNSILYNLWRTHLFTLPCNVYVTSPCNVTLQWRTNVRTCIRTYAKVKTQENAPLLLLLFTEQHHGGTKAISSAFSALQASSTE